MPTRAHAIEPRTSLRADDQPLPPLPQEGPPAELFVRAGDVSMRKWCSEHGAMEALYWRDAGLYRQMHDVVGE